MRSNHPGTVAAPRDRRPKPGDGPRGSLPVLFALLTLSGVVTAACTEDPLGSAPDEAPGPTSPTVEVFLRADELVDWRDTTLVGFALPTEGSFTLLADREDLQARILGRFPLPDSLLRSGDTLPADSFLTASVRMAIDTANSVLEGTATVRLHALDRGFDEFAATWSEAREGVPWAALGGDLGQVLGIAELSRAPDSSAADSVVIELDSSVDSLLKAWTASDGEPGFAIVLDGPGVTLRVRQILLRFEALLEGDDEPEPFQRNVDPSTFITEAVQPAPGTGLRLGGLPAARAYLSFVVPDTIGGFPVRGSRIGAAQLLFHPLTAAEAPFTLDRLVVGGRVDLLLDPFDLGEKTPILGTTSLFAQNPDSLAAGVPVRVDVTTLLAELASLPGDSVRPIWLGLRAVPDGQSFGFWELGSVEAPPELRPQLTVILTPPVDFQLAQ